MVPLEILHRAAPCRNGCVPQTLVEWVKRVEVDTGVREGVTSSEAQRVSAHHDGGIAALAASA